MVGLHLFASKNNRSGTPPPPAYNENDPSPVLFQTRVTTTEVVTTTTQTTTHLFSLPLWRKRTAAPFNSVSASSAARNLDADEMGYAPQFRLEKDLPPTPNGSSGQGSPLELSRASSQENSMDEIARESQSPTLFPESAAGRYSFGSPRPVSSTGALAQATLGLSLPHVLPLASASSSSAEINSIAFTSTPSTSELHPPRRDHAVLTKPRAVSTAGRQSASTEPQDTPSQRRTRGLSLGPSGFLGFGSSDVKAKGKEKEKEVEETGNHTPTKSLTRRASFWSRKKVVPPESHAFARRSEVNLVSLPPPPLPALPLISPFNIDMNIPPSSEPPPPKPHHTRGLSRSHSERARRSSRTPEPHTSKSAFLQAETPKAKQARRPTTSDGATRPKISRFALSGSSEPLTSSPLASPTLEREEAPFSTEPSPSSRRPRAQTNPPLLHRLSLNLFASSSSPATNHPSSSSSPVISSSPLRTSLSKPSPVPKPQVDEESPEGYLSRLMVSVSKAEIAGVLASSADNFHVQALRAYIGRFDFADDPLDVALRRLLMDVGLPRETQQIDRVMEAFASRYYQRHPSLFSSEDQPYVLAFSLIMLHTDAFNKSNKRKMTKADYIKNTRMPGVAPEVLDCFYDNIVFAPFIFVEDPLDVNGQRGYSLEGSRVMSSSSSSGNISGPTLLGKANKVDPYYLISNNLLDPLRVDVEMFVPLIDPYSYEGTGGPWNEEELQLAFANARVIEIGSLETARVISPGPFFSAGGSAAGPFALGNELHTPSTDAWSLKVTKVGTLNRKDDVLEGGKKASSRKWKSWSVLLTGSQLLFIRDPAWATTFLDQGDSSQQVYLPHTTVFKPDEVLSVKDAVAVYDRSYSKHDNAFRFAMADGRQYLFGTSNSTEMNEWISRINYASAFKSTGVRMRPVGMSGRDVQLTGVAAATSHLHDLQYDQSRTDWDNEASRDLMDMLSGEDSRSRKPQPKRRVTIMSSSSDMDTDVPVAPEIEGADQFKATFDQVKADLAAGRCASPDSDSPAGEASDLGFSLPENTRLPSRSQVVLSKARDLESKMSASQTQLDSDLRFVRNIATLTPFQRSTRERLSQAVLNISKRIMQVRLDIAKYTCHRNVLYNDLAAEGKNWSRAKKLALRTATETLESHQPIPRMTFSVHESKPLSSSSVPIPPKSYTPSAHHKSESTVGSFQSFHSALDFGPEWPSPDDTTSSDLLGAYRIFDSPINSSSGSLKEDGGEAGPVSSRSRFHVGSPSEAASPRTSDDTMQHEKYYTARESAEELEQAEEWNKTRCAQRVSLVRVPSAIGPLSARKFERDASR